MTPVGNIAPFWDDLDVGPGGIFGARRSGYTVISWENAKKADDTTGPPTYALNFQVKFFDTGNIEFHYGTMTGTGNTSAANNAKGASALVAFQPPQGRTTGFTVSSNQANIVANSGYRFTAQ
jgi:hypothetical protein